MATGKQKIAERSREWFWKAFLELLQEKDYQKITITEIAQKAQLDRRTFYRSFKGKNELINWYCKKSLAEYHALIYQQKQPLSVQKGLKLFFDFWWERRKTMHLLIINDLSNNFLNIWTQAAIKNYYFFNESWRIKGDPNQVKYIETYITGGLWQTVNFWLAKDDPEKPEVITQTFIKVLDALIANY